MMGKVWSILKFAGRWLGPALVILAVLMFLVVPMPFPEFERPVVLAGAVISAIAWLFTRAPTRRKTRRILAIAALIGVSFYGWRVWEERRGYHEEIVSFDNGGVHLVGTLYLPDRPGKVPGMVLLTGSGTTPRNAYRSYAAHFAQTGYAVLLYDKRGVGASSGERPGFLSMPKDYEPLARDAAAALSVLAARPEVRPDAVGFVGVSEGGFLAPRAAVLNGQARFLLSLTSPTAALYELVRFHRPSALAKVQGAGIADFDPMPSLQTLAIPGLWLMAEKDQHFSNAATASDLEALRRLGKPYEYRLIPGAWHGFLIGPKAVVHGAIDQWLARVTATAPERVQRS